MVDEAVTEVAAVQEPGMRDEEINAGLKRIEPGGAGTESGLKSWCGHWAPCRADGWCTAGRPNWTRRGNRWVGARLFRRKDRVRASPSISPRHPRSEERRVGEECRSPWAPYHLKKKKE